MNINKKVPSAFHPSNLYHFKFNFHKIVFMLTYFTNFLTKPRVGLVVENEGYFLSSFIKFDNIEYMLIECFLEHMQLIF